MDQETMLARSSWQYRAVEATQGRTSRLGKIVLAIINHTPKDGKGCFSPKAEIVENPETKRPWIRAGWFIDFNGLMTPNAMVCDLQDCTDNFQHLADHLKLSDAEKLAMFTALQKWIVRDYRAVNDTKVK